MRWFLPAMRMLNLRGVALLDLSGWGGAEFPFIVRAPDRSAVCRKAIPYASLKTSS